jgi:hypothetical protein
MEKNVEPMKNLMLFEEFGNEELKNLTYFSFDVDDNLLYMPTKIHMEHLVDGEWIEEPVDTEKFVTVRNDKANWRYLASHDGEGSFVEFRDWSEDGDKTFLNDFKYAVLHKRFAPSWAKFIECLVNGHIFSIITSRGHAPDNIRIAIYWLIYQYGLNNFKNLPLKGVDKIESLEDQMIQNLLKYHELFGSEPDDVIMQYIQMCPIYTISSPYFMATYGKYPPEEAKRVALRDFNKVVKRYADDMGVKAEYGFSDDDPKFIKAAIEEFLELSQKNKNLKYTVFDTGGDRKIKKVKL